MTNEERDIISQFIGRVSGGRQAAGQTPFGGSVPATTSPTLPPVDREADALIGDLFTRYPEARYRITQLAFVQEHALAEAQNRIKRLEWEVQQAQQAAQQAQVQQQQAAQQPSGARPGFFGGLFGGGQQAAPPQGGPGPAWNQAPQPGYQQAPPPPPPPQYGPNYQPGMFQRSGSGFLGSALTTAAGVAGGLVAGNALMSLFSGSRGGAEAFGGASPLAAANPWGGAPAVAPEQGYVDQGTWSTDPGTPQVDQASSDNQGYVDNGSWDTSTDQSSWTDNSSSGSDDDSLI
jgi:hypothetical protein